MPKPVDIVVVSYNSAGVLGPTLAGLCALGAASVTVVDNHSSDDSAAIARDAGADVIENARNLGFGTACNTGAAEGTAGLILFVNPDAEVTPPALEALLDAAERHPDAAGFNPQILNQDGSPYLRGPGLGGRHLPAPEAFADGEIDTLSGAVLLCRRAAFEQIGGFDPQIFLFFEDDDLAMRLRAEGWALRQAGAAHVPHAIGTGSAPALRTLLFKERCFARARRYLAAKHGIAFDRRREALRALRRLILACLTLDRTRVLRNLGRLQGYLGSS
ncbi:MAG: glycosyltransferase family 2 protein [Pseudomonadota bacterium]